MCPYCPDVLNLIWKESWRREDSESVFRIWKISKLTDLQWFLAHKNYSNIEISASWLKLEYGMIENGSFSENSRLCWNFRYQGCFQFGDFQEKRVQRYASLQFFNFSRKKRHKARQPPIFFLSFQEKRVSRHASHQFLKIFKKNASQGTAASDS